MQRYVSVTDIAKLHKKSANQLHDIISRHKIKPYHRIKLKCKGFGYDSNASFGSASKLVALYDLEVIEYYLNKIKSRAT